ncbi:MULTISPECIES: phosphomannomutase/phosphoglucomutase [unclassified Pseudodesulfovibrio]|uniref:phosphomannomutase/phosphoglucomutase n=1 Tax=unclassified Pseudodesulfovibrio TaxID=2661612 RepID=UPI000FEB5F23|nr:MULTISPECIES: phosphomannomutase/phosphoglucomutase [unclassified Pseudodesulfovibrio]MCJ2163498.1 phosphomannomutase/phosphoglucomutase [Pseudodesulfovibrio sp. S3-i]RWU06733.1 phosphomannomutase/phosphoglucomutase [Pseudodesulfovibrio sp. S3]
MKPILREVFRTYDIRGIVDSDFDEEWVERLGRACGTYFLQHGSKVAVVGHDCRHSSPAYAEAMTRGLNATGVDVITIGQVSSPAFYWAVTKFGETAGVMITASHNPSEYNGFKVWQGVSTIHSEEVQVVYDIMEKGDFPKGSGSARHEEILGKYVEELAADVTFKRPVKVVVDGGNGTGGTLTADALERAGAEVIRLYCDPDGDFPNHHPDPVVEKNMAALQKTVLAEKADIGIGLDGDGDRIGVVTEKGELLFGDQLVAIYARDILKTFPGASIIGEVKCSHLMYADIKAHGGDAVMWKTGHSLIKARMREIDAKFAGEMSGHMFFADRYYGFDDATYAALRIVEILSQSDEPMSGHLKTWPKTYYTPELRAECPEALKPRVVQKAVEYFSSKFDVVDIDGVRAIFPDGWGLIRASNTQPVLVLRFEAETQERLDEIRTMFEDKLKTWIAEG